MSVLFAVALWVGQLGDAAPPAAPPTGSSPAAETSDSRPHQLGLMLRCPVCQGMPIAESPSETAQAMMARVRTLVAEGKTDQEVLDYFVSRYGEWVLLEPKARGINLGLWLFPLLALLGGLVVLLRFAKKHTRSTAARPADAPGDDYLRAVREEIKR